MSDILLKILLKDAGRRLVVTISTKLFILNSSVSKLKKVLIILLLAIHMNLMKTTKITFLGEEDQTI